MIYIHTGDLHLGCTLSERGPLAEFYLKILEEIADKAILEKAPVLVAGDFFDSYNPDNYTLMTKVAESLRRLRDSGISVIAVQGNHDNARSRHGVLDFYDASGLLKLTRYEEKEGWLVLYPLRIGDQVFYGIPGFRNQAESRYIKEKRVVFKGLDEARKNSLIILAHVSIEFAGFKPSSYSYMYGRMDVLRDEFTGVLPPETRYVALGHIHLPIPSERVFKSNIAYPGAPIGMNAMDLRDSARLEKAGVKRRILLVDISSDTPLVKAFELQNTPRVIHEKVYTSNLDELKKHLEKTIRDYTDYHSFIIDVEGLRIESSGELSRIVQELQRKHSKLIHLKLTGEESVKSILVGFNPSIEVTGELSVDELEAEILKEYVEKQGLRIPFEKVHEILRLMYEEREEKGESFYRSLYDKIKEALREIYGKAENVGK